MKTIKDVVIFLAEHEGKKLQVDIAQMSEITKLVSLLAYSKPESIAILLTHGKEVYEETLKEMEKVEAVESGQ